MVELQSCSASLVNASSALSAIETQEVRGESGVNHVIAEISAELQRERQKNAELLEKISFLESQIQRKPNDSLPTHRQFKRQKTEVPTDKTDNAIKSEPESETKSATKCLDLVNWMSMDETRISQFERTKDGESTANCDDTDDSDTDDDHENYNEEHVGIKSGNDHKCGVVEPSQETKEELIGDKIAVECIRNDKAVSETVLDSRSLNMSNSKKPPKVAFCPREVKRIIESEALQQGNAQSHTIRKIIVFASLGIRHGCEDMYELDFDHFSILRKGEPYESPSNPGEHVLYENPGYRRKVFYPNRQNPMLCPVQILEEEKAMRPSDSTCPSCLFLCIKYGGRTRNLPQNEYVRQRMGRNKLKSFGPLICRMAMLANIRSGSFFFKALGITLLFMAGFPDELVQRETKYRNLDLLQKYYRTDEEARGEELFLQHPIINSDAASPSSPNFTRKTFRTKQTAKKQAKSNSNSNSNSSNKPQQNTQVTPSVFHQQPGNVHLNSAPLAQFGLMGFASVHAHTMAAFQPISSRPQSPLDNTANSNTNLNNVSYIHNQITTPYHHMVSHQPANGFVPQAVMYWPQPHYATTYHAYRSFQSPGSYIALHPQPYNSYTCHASATPSVLAEDEVKRDEALKEAESDHSDRSSSSTQPLKD